jgi:hypothetical protein
MFFKENKKFKKFLLYILLIDLGAKKAPITSFTLCVHSRKLKVKRQIFLLMIFQYFIKTLWLSITLEPFIRAWSNFLCEQTHVSAFRIFYWNERNFIRRRRRKPLKTAAENVSWRLVTLKKVIKNLIS